MSWTDDPAADFSRYDAEMEAELKRRPRCTNCGEYIQQESAVCLDGNYFCDDCIESMREYLVG